MLKKPLTNRVQSGKHGPFGRVIGAGFEVSVGNLFSSPLTESSPFNGATNFHQFNLIYSGPKARSLNGNRLARSDGTAILIN